jgi:hypothetical protein
MFLISRKQWIYQPEADGRRAHSPPGSAAITSGAVCEPYELPNQLFRRIARPLADVDERESRLTAPGG